MKTSNRAGRQSAGKSVKTQTGNNTENPTGKTPAALRENFVLLNDDTGLVDLTLFDDTGTLVEGLAIPPALYAKLQPYIATAKAQHPPTPLEYLETHGVKFGSLNAPADNRTSCTFEISEGVMDRLEKIEPHTKRSDLWASIFLDGLCLAERRARVDMYYALQNIEGVAAELEFFNDALRAAHQTWHDEGHLNKQNNEHRALGHMLLNNRLRDALTAGLAELRAAHTLTHKTN